MTSFKQRIQQAIVQRVVAEKFYGGTFDPNTKVFTVDTATPVVPAQILANETGASFAEPQRNRQSFKQERSSWSWRLIIGFNVEISSEAFEQSLIEKPIRVLADPALGQQQVDIVLVDVQYEHPPQQQSPSGSRLTYSLAANVGPS